MKKSAPTLRTVEDVQAFTRECFSSARGSHDWEHTRRVHATCMQMGRTAGADLEVLSVAAYLHDLGRPYQDESNGAVCHAEKGAAIAAALLADYPLSDNRKKNVLHCIRAHRHRGACRPESLEARILFDADKLDAIGAIGIGRAFLFAGEVGAKLHNPELAPEKSAPYSVEDTGYREFKLKLSKIRDRMLTGEGRRMAQGRHRFMEAFFKRFLEEYEGLK